LARVGGFAADYPGFCNPKTYNLDLFKIYFWKCQFYTILSPATG
jgi:hypothetical protein